MGELTTFLANLKRENAGTIYFSVGPEGEIKMGAIESVGRYTHELKPDKTSRTREGHDTIELAKGKLDIFVEFPQGKIASVFNKKPEPYRLQLGKEHKLVIELVRDKLLPESVLERFNGKVSRDEKSQEAIAILDETGCKFSYKEDRFKAADRETREEWGKIPDLAEKQVVAFDFHNPFVIRGKRGNYDMYLKFVWVTDFFSAELVQSGQKKEKSTPFWKKIKGKRYEENGVVVDPIEFQRSLERDRRYLHYIMNDKFELPSGVDRDELSTFFAKHIITMEDQEISLRNAMAVISAQLKGKGVVIKLPGLKLPTDIPLQVAVKCHAHFNEQLLEQFISSHISPATGLISQG